MGEVVALFESNEVTVSHSCLECKTVFPVTFEKDMPKADCPACGSGKVVAYELAPVRDSYGPPTVCECGCNLFYALPFATMQCSRCAAIYEEEEDEDGNIYALEEADIIQLEIAHTIEVEAGRQTNEAQD